MALIYAPSESETFAKMPTEILWDPEITSDEKVLWLKLLDKTIRKYRVSGKYSISRLARELGFGTTGSFYNALKRLRDKGLVEKSDGKGDIKLSIPVQITSLGIDFDETKEVNLIMPNFDEAKHPPTGAWAWDFFAMEWIWFTKGNAGYSYIPKEYREQVLGKLPEVFKDLTSPPPSASEQEEARAWQEFYLDSTKSREEKYGDLCPPDTEVRYVDTEEEINSDLEKYFPGEYPRGEVFAWNLEKAAELRAIRANELALF